MQRIGILGAGFMGKTHADAYKTMENATLAAVCDQNATLGDEFAAQYGCPAFTDAAAMLAGAQLDVLDICLPTFLHEEHALLGAKHQKHVFCEKPVALGLTAERADAAREGVRIGIENVWNGFLLSPLETARLVDEVDSEWFGVYFDVGNVMHIGLPQQWIEILAGRIFKIHLSDYRRGQAGLGAFVDLFAGDVDFKAVAAALQRIGYDDWLTLEMLPNYRQFPEVSPLSNKYAVDKIVQLCVNDNLAHFLKMTYQERLELKQANPSEYDGLAEAMRDWLNLKEPEAAAPKSKARFEKLTDAKTGNVRYIFHES